MSGPGGTRLLPLAGRVAVVTGVSRRAGNGFAIVRRLVDDGAAVFATGWPAHDAERPWGADPVQSDLFPSNDDVLYRPVDLADREGPRQVIEGATATFEAVDILVANHARRSSQDLSALTAGELDLAWAVNTRATLLLIQIFARCHNDERCGGRVVLFTSGQHLAPMLGELPYVATKGAIHQVTATLADELADRSITVFSPWHRPALRRNVRRAAPQINMPHSAGQGPPTGNTSSRGDCNMARNASHQHRL